MFYNKRVEVNKLQFSERSDINRKLAGLKNTVSSEWPNLCYLSVRAKLHEKLFITADVKLLWNFI